jgi:hypothetical protein
MFFRQGPAARLRTRRLLRLLSALSFALVLVAITSMWILFPSRENPTPSDVVMVIAGSSDGRHQLGARLVEERFSENFVVSNPLGRTDKIGSAHCRGADRPESVRRVWCLVPVPSKTIGEVMAMKELAKKEEWETATVVTSRVHARRVSTMFAQCTDLDVNVIFVDRLWMRSVIGQVLHEVGGYIKFWVTNPCRD